MSDAIVIGSYVQSGSTCVCTQQGEGRVMSGAHACIAAAAGRCCWPLLRAAAAGRCCGGLLPLSYNLI